MPSYLRVMDGFQHSLLLASASFCKMHQNAQCFGYGSTLLIFDPYRRIRAEDFEASLLLIQQPDHSTFLTQETQAALQWDPCWPHVDPMVTTRPATTNQEAVGPGPGVSVKPQILWLPKNSRNFGQAVQGRSKLQTYWSYWFHIDFTSIYIYLHPERFKYRVLYVLSKFSASCLQLGNLVK